MNAAAIEAKLHALSDPQRVAGQTRFFKTGPGQYGEGDLFWGISVPQTRALARQESALPLEEIAILLENPIHEVRLCALLIMVEQYKQAQLPDARRQLIDFYLSHTHAINNWDLVDLSVGMLGNWLLDTDRSVLYRLAHSPVMWEQRIAVVSTHTLIRAHDFTDTLRLCALLLGHPHDLMHKAMGWMLREVGKKDRPTLENFLEQHWATMPRTMFRYALERFPEDERLAWLRRKKG